MSNTNTKVLMYIGYSLLATQAPVEPIIPSAESDEGNKVPSYENTLEENVLPDTKQVLQTLLPINPTTLRI